MSEYWQALILAAGLGSRLKDLTGDRPKAMVEFRGIPIIGRAVQSLNRAGIRDITIVVGYKSDVLQAYVDNAVGDIKVRYVKSEVYRSTGTAYSVWLARDLLRGNCLVVEGDVVFGHAMVSDLIASAGERSSIAVAPFRAPLEGTTVGLSGTGTVTGFQRSCSPGSFPERYKTINLHALRGRDFDLVLSAASEVLPTSPATYFEDILDREVRSDSLSLGTLVVPDTRAWAEIDTAEDLAWAEQHLADTTC